MKIGFIGAGSVAASIARSALAAGHHVVLSNQMADKLAKVVDELGTGASAGSAEEVVESDIVVLAVPWLKIGSALSGLPAWNGRILVDATNPFVEFEPKLTLADLGDKSASEVVAELAPGASVVKAFNSITMTNFNEGARCYEAKRALFVSGDSEDAKAQVKQLITSFGFAVIDLGGLRAGGLLQQAGGPIAGKDILVRE
ncbi:NAD(P)-binding domain-containing protein (plasmid) [Agrobacterium tumefaciens]|uniref:NADPH-dependent F420 reductase n=1 Tax=Agrobacterium tumefaciens TaxID=358 RepID=UPI001573AD19|nr:NAD(P)-binding domain-containing protein [Agrobacterium tumefaciens]WCA62385.1 NAD(P)-binding domain-containing protein [Agrobacterium tumefaciens]